MPRLARGRAALLPLLSLVALAATAVRAAWPNSCSDDGAFHLLRLVQWDHLLRQGIWYSRWAPDMAAGYGYPLFNFYAPLAYYAGVAFSWMSADLAIGFRLTFALGLVGAGLGAYRLARDHFGPLAALAAATAYLYAPYQAFDILFRGNLAEALIFPLLPLALWSTGRFSRGGGRGWLLAAAGSYAAIILTHNSSALIVSPLLGLYGLVEAGADRAGRRSGHRLWRRIARPALPLALGLGLSTFFWLPALAERSLVHSDRLLVPPVFVYWTNFLTWSEILAAPRAVWPALLNPSPPRSLGLVPVLLALPAVAGLGRWRDGRRRQTLFFLAALGGYTSLMLAPSRPVWDTLPLLEFVQFPWRLLGPASLALALLVGAGLELLAGLATVRSALSRAVPGRRVGPGPLARRGLGAVYLLALPLAALAWLDARICPGLESPTVADITAYEIATDTVGTTAKGEYLPRTVAHLPSEPYTTPFSLPPGDTTATLATVRRTPLRFQAAVTAAAPLTVTVNALDYAGWQARVDGRPVPIVPAPGDGRITVAVPAGRHELDVRFGPTPLRRAAGLVTALSVLLLGGAAVWWPRLAPPAEPGTETPESGRRGAVWSHLLAVIAGLAVYLVVFYLLPGRDTPWRRAGLPPAPNPIVFQGHLTLLDYDLPLEARPVDDPRRVDLVWTLHTPPGPSDNYQTSLSLLDDTGLAWTDKTRHIPRGYRDPYDTRFWQPGQFARESQLLTPLPGTPPGRYQAWLTLFRRDTLAPVARRDGPPALSLGTIELTRPRRPPDLAELAPQFRPATDPWRQATGLRLLGYNLDRQEARPGDPFLLTLFWGADRVPAADFSARLRLIDGAGRVALSRQEAPVRVDWPTSRWRPGDAWRGQWLMRLPAGLPGGHYQWELALCPPSGACLSAVDLGPLAVTAPRRQYSPPPLEIPLIQTFDGQVTLLGLTVQPVDETALVVTLAWRAEREMALSYRVFLQLWDTDGAVLAASDGEPADWSRPTTGWLPGEIVTETRRLTLPTPLAAGDYRLAAGLYDPGTGRRLQLPDGADAALAPWSPGP